MRARHVKEWLRLPRRTSNAQGNQHSSVVFRLCRQSGDAENRKEAHPGASPNVDCDYYLEEAEFQFDVMVGFEVPQHGIHGIGGYSVERLPRRKGSDDDLKSPWPRLGVYAMSRGECNSEHWIHMLNPISSRGDVQTCPAFERIYRKRLRKRAVKSMWPQKCLLTVGGFRKLLTTNILVWRLLLRSHTLTFTCQRVPYSLIRLRY